MNDDRRTIGTTGAAGRGAAGRGGSGSSPSAAARSLAGGTQPARKAPTKKKAAESAKKTDSPQKVDSAKVESSKKASSGSRSASASTRKPASASKTGTAKKASSTKASTAGPKKSTAKKTATTKTAGAGGPRLRAVTDEDAAAAAAAAAEEAQRKTKTAGPATLPGIPLEDIVMAVVQGAQRVLGSDWDKQLATMVHAVRKRLAGDYAIDEFGFDRQITEVAVSAVEPLAERWFRLEVRGAENIPTDGGALLVSNHSGTVPLDGVMAGYAVKKHTGRDLRPLGADLVFALPWVGQMARKLGATLACSEDAERLLNNGELAGVWPEGFKGIGKPFSQRYRLQRFGRGGFVSSALRAQVPIVPVSIVGAEEIYPLVGNVPSIARMLGLPYLPITPFFPLLGPLGLIPLPSKWIIEFGEPIRTDTYEPDAADDPMLLFNVTDQVRETIQQTLYELLVDRGNAFF